ncbi:hypothetical protein PSCICN_38300 [Pseudomonas cichorii]|uniref:hypothetical protein n=1 Tax=Pseudomonas cichorii TaxID=36746 RepID=UPI00191055DE|nr:hypothetical protein [Pseudomonas cichorii]GFM83138.1 hypothetical protein PSCICN_38300 [Pseudomonas cichorii]
MQAIIYAGMRNGERDQMILEALTFKHVKEVATEFKLALSTIRSIAKRIQGVAVYDLNLQGGVVQSELVRLPPTRSERLLSACTETFTAHFATSN